MNKVKRKRVLMFLFVLLLGIGLLGCDSKKEVDDEDYVLDSEMDLKIRETFLKEIKDKSKKSTCTIDDIVIKKFLGKYKDNYAVIFKGDIPNVFADIPVFIGGYEFSFFYGFIRIWNEYELYYLGDAYDLELISSSDLEKIHKKHNEGQQ